MSSEPQHKPIHVFTLPNGEFIFVSTNGQCWSSWKDWIKMFIGPRGVMREIIINEVEIFRDDGSTRIRTDEGSLIVPTHLDKSAESTWNNIQLKRVRTDLFKIGTKNNATSLAS